MKKANRDFECRKSKWNWKPKHYNSNFITLGRQCKTWSRLKMMRSQGRRKVWKSGGAITIWWAWFAPFDRKETFLLKTFYDVWCLLCPAVHLLSGLVLASQSRSPGMSKDCDKRLGSHQCCTFRRPCIVFWFLAWSSSDLVKKSQISLGPCNLTNLSKFLPHKWSRNV